MANYTIPDNPEYTTAIRKLENTDPANAEAVLNPLLETLIENTHAVKLEADDHKHDAGDISSGVLSLSNGGTGATTSANACDNLGALPKSGGTMTGPLYAQTNTSYTTAQMRNISASTSDLTAGSSNLTNGSIYLVYE